MTPGPVTSGFTTVLALGLDIGGTKISAGLVNPESGAVVDRIVEPTHVDRGGEVVLDTAVAMAQALSSKARLAGRSIGSVGIGVPELVNPDGQIRSAFSFDWRDLPCRERFESIAPTVIDSDVRAAALAESRFGAGRRFADFVYVSVGTGISSCLVQGGTPRVGVNGNALVLATAPLTVFDETGAPCQFTLEPFASGSGIAARYGALTGQMTGRAEVVITAAETGDSTATAVVESAAVALGSALSWLVNVLDPGAVVVGGGLGCAGGRFWERLITATREHIWSDDSRDLPIAQATLGPESGWIGAALAGYQQINAFTTV